MRTSPSSSHRRTLLTEAAQAAQQELARLKSDGGGPAEQQLHRQRRRLADQVRRIEAARAAARRLQQLDRRHYQALQSETALAQRAEQIPGELRRLPPLLRAGRRRELEAELEQIRQRRAELRERLQSHNRTREVAERAARAAAHQAPPEALWPQASQRHAELERDWEQTRQAARQDDLEAGRIRWNTVLHQGHDADRQLQRAREEDERRADLPPEIRAVEHAARIDQHKHERQTAYERPADQVPPRSPASRNRTAQRQPPSHGRDDAGDGGRNR